MKTTFLNGPLDPRKHKPKKYIQIMTSDDIDTNGKPDQRDASFKHGTYEKVAESPDGPIFEWRGVPR